MSREIDIFLLFYDDLINQLARTLVRLAYFLGVDLSPEDLQCILEHEEGSYHRSDHNHDMFKNISVNISGMLPGHKLFKEKVAECLKERKCMTSGCAFMDM